MEEGGGAEGAKGLGVSGDGRLVARVLVVDS